MLPTVEVGRKKQRSLGTFRLRDEGYADLEDVAKALKADPNAVVELQGFADPRGTDVYNYRLTNVAALTIAVPWMVMSTMMLTEVAAYPAFVWAILALQRSIAKPSPSRDLLAVGVVRADGIVDIRPKAASSGVDGEQGTPTASQAES